jgi:rod shape-determining protein MreD
MISLIKHILVLFVLLSLQLAVVPFLPGEMSSLNVILVVTVFVCLVYRFSLGIAYAIFLGVVLDLLSAAHFGVVMITLLMTLYVVYLIFNHLLTNKSVYTLIGLTIIASFVYNIIFFIYKAMMYFLATKDVQILKQVMSFGFNDMLWQILFNSLLVIILFIVSHASSQRFKAVFIDTTR